MADNTRPALLIDAGYLDKLVSDLFADRQGGKKVPLALDFRRLPEALAGEKPHRVLYYHAMPWVSDPPLPAEHAAYEAKKRFIDFLARQNRWVLREGTLEKRGDDKLVQKRVDVMLAIDMVRLALTHEVTTAVVLAGDSDFVPAFEMARGAGMRVVLRHGPGTAHPDLVAAASTARGLTREQLEAVRLPSR